MKVIRKAIFYNIILVILVLLFTNKTYVNSYILDDLSKFELINKIKNYLLENSELYLPQYQAFVNSLVLGEQIDYNIKEKFVKTGIYHILSLSGMHVGLLFICTNFLLSFTKNRYLKGILSIIVIIIYGIMTGLKIATARAIIMSIILVYGTFINRKSDALNSLSIASIFLLLYNKNYIYSTSYLLSFVIVCGIILYGKFLKEILLYIILKLKVNPEKWIYIIDYFAICISAYLVSLPLNLLFFGEFNVMSLGINLLICFIIPIIYVLSVFTLVTGITFFIGISEVFINYVYAVTDIFYSFNTIYKIQGNITYTQTYIILLCIFGLLKLILLTIKYKDTNNGKT